MSKSHVWKYFVRQGDKARCKVGDCIALLAVKSTSSLSYHLEKTHNIFKTSASESQYVKRATNEAWKMQVQSQSQDLNKHQHKEPKTLPSASQKTESTTKQSN